MPLSFVGRPRKKIIIDCEKKRACGRLAAVFFFLHSPDENEQPHCIKIIDKSCFFSRFAFAYSQLNKVICTTIKMCKFCLANKRLGLYSVC